MTPAPEDHRHALILVGMGLAEMVTPSVLDMLRAEGLIHKPLDEWEPTPKGREVIG